MMPGARLARALMIIVAVLVIIGMLFSVVRFGV